MGLFAAAEEIPKQALAAVRPVRLGDASRVPRLDGRPRRGQRPDPGRPQRGAPLRDGRGRARTGRDRRRDRRDGRDLSRRRWTPAPPGSAAARRRTSAASTASTSRRSSPTAPRPARWPRPCGARASACCRSTRRRKRDGLSDEDRALLVELAEISGAVVSWNDFGMGTPNGDSVLEFMEAELAARPRDLRRGAVPAARDALHAEEALGDLRQLRAVGRAVQLDPADKLAALGDPGVAGAPRRVLGRRRSSW